MPPRLSIIVPAYNEASRLATTLRAILDYLNRSETGAELIVVDDGSRDDTAMVAERAVADSKSLTTWGNLDYLVLAFAEALRRSARCFVHVASVERWLQRLQARDRSDRPGVLRAAYRAARSCCRFASRLSIGDTGAGFAPSAAEAA